MRIEELLDREGLSDAYRQTIEELHVPLAREILRRQQAEQHCLTVGLCGSQGSGKSTMAGVLQALLQEQRLRCAVLSLDDIYLTRAAREALAEQVHPLLRTRGVPGTHDVALGLRTLHSLRRAGAVALPSFDKSRDDRRPEEQWVTVSAPVDVVLFEGWCVGANPQSDAALGEPINDLERELDAQCVWRRYANRALATEYRALFSEINMLVLLAAPSFEVVYRWRLEQEHKLRARMKQRAEDGARTMSDEQVANFIMHYERLTRHILAEMPARADVVIRLNASRACVAVDYR